MQQKLKTASYSEQLQFLTFVPDKWSQMYCSEYFNVFEYHAWTLGRILAKPVPKKRKETITTETLHLLRNFYEDDNFSRYVPEKKDHVGVSKGVHNEKVCNYQKSLQFAKNIYCFQTKHQNVNIRFSKFCTLRPKWGLLAGSKMIHSVCVCRAHQNIVLLVDAIEVVCINTVTGPHSFAIFLVF